MNLSSKVESITRPHLDSLPSYQPGRRPEQIAAELGIDSAIKLSSNELPFDPLPGVVQALRDYATQINRYPDMSATQLRSQLAQRYGVDVEQVVTGCGSVALCEHLALATAEAGDEIVFGWRSFEAYPLIVGRLGAVGIQVPNTPDHRLDVVGIAAAITSRTRLVFLCSPNNPTGTALNSAELTWLLEQIPDTVMVVLDEAYREFVTDPDVPDGVTLLAEHPNLVILRTFSKAWGLAALRVGYLVAGARITSVVQKILTTYSTSGTAQIAALAALAEEQEVFRRVNAVVVERERVTAQLRQFFPRLPASQGNFVWLPAGKDTATIGRALEAHGLIVRALNGDNPHTADRDGLRVTIGSRDDNDALLSAAAQILTPLG